MSSLRGIEKFHETLVGEEGDGVDGEGPQAVQGKAFEEDPHSLLSEAHSHAVEDPAVLPPAGPRHLEPGFDHIHGRGEGPGHHARHAARHQYCKCT